MVWNRASFGGELQRADFFFVDAFVAWCTMCCGLCGKLRFIICLVLWACDVTDEYLLFPASKSGSSVCVRIRDSYDDVLLCGELVDF